MELIHIVPRNNLKFYQEYATRDQPAETSRVMCLTHLVEDFEDYREFFLAYPGYKILDNSLIELKGAADIERVVRAAMAIKADEIILPDVFQDRYGTTDAVLKALDWLSKHEMLYEYKLMAVCQGYSANSFDECFKELQAIHEIDVIGIPKVCAKMHQAGRPYFEYLWKNAPVNIHLLGLWYSWEELHRYDLSRIRSLDSCQLAFQSAYNLPQDAVRPDGFTVDLKYATCNTLDLLRRASEINRDYK